MVDAHAVDEVLGEPPGDLGVRGVEHLPIFLAQTGQRGDREEAPVTADAVAPAHQPIVLTVVHVGAGAFCGARREGQSQVAQPQPVPVDLQIGGVVVGAQDRQHDAPVVVEVPVDVEIRCVVRGTAVPQDVPPPGVLLGLVDADVVGHDVDHQAHAPLAGRRRQPRQPLGAAEFRRHRRRVGDVVAVVGPGGSGHDRRQVQMRHPEVVEVIQQVLGVRQGEREPAGLTAQLQPVSRQNWKGHDVTTSYAARAATVAAPRFAPRRPPRGRPCPSDRWCPIPRSTPARSRRAASRTLAGRRR